MEGAEGVETVSRSLDSVSDDVAAVSSFLSGLSSSLAGEFVTGTLASKLLSVSWSRLGEAVGGVRAAVLGVKTCMREWSTPGLGAEGPLDCAKFGSRFVTEGKPRAADA